MIPLRDNIPSRSTPFVNYGLMLICGLVFLLQATDKHGLLTLQYGMIPQRISDPEKPVVIEEHKIIRTPFGIHEVSSHTEVPPSPIPAGLTAYTCVLLHGS